MRLRAALHHCAANPRGENVDSQKALLVSGGAGFLGSHLCDRLHEAGHDVLCVDNYYTGRRSNVAHLLDSDRFTLRFTSHAMRVTPGARMLVWARPFEDGESTGYFAL